MKRIEFAFFITMMALVVYEIVMVSKDPDWMWGKKTAVLETDAKVEEVAEEIETVAETVHFECVEAHIELIAAAEVETTEETVPETESEAPETTPVYEVDGIILNEEVQAFLYRCLEAEGIEWWMPYAMMQIRQESRFDVNATSLRADGTYDRGLLQYSEKWWPWHCEQYGYTGSDVYDYYAQIAIYAKQVAERLNAGKDIAETISDHYTGGAYYNAQYVADVLQWVNKTREVKG